MRLVALTGGIASGKSTVANYLATVHHVTIIDSDKIAYELQKPGTQVFQRLVSTFGSQIVSPDGTLNRKRLGEIVFKNPDERRKLNSIVHPHVYRQIFVQCFRAWITRQKIVVLDIPLFFEIGKIPRKYFHDIVTVYVTSSVQLQRLMDRNQLTEDEARSRINAQIPLEKKREMSTVVIDNTGTADDSKRQVDALVAKWEKSIPLVPFFPDPLLVLAVILLLLGLMIKSFFA